MFKKEDYDFSYFDDNKSHKFMGEELMVPNMDKVESNRGYMVSSSHLPQHVNLIKPEMPLVYTNFENQFGDHSDIGFYDAETDFKILDKVRKNENVYYLIIERDNGIFDIIEKRNEMWLTEKYGFVYDTSVIDGLEKDDFVKKGTRLYKSHAYDDNDNLMYGMNLLTAYYTMKCMTLEDAFVISKSASKRMSSHKIEKIKVVINNNDLLLNLNEEDNGIYISFPSINEDITNFLAVRRRLAYKNLFKFDDLTLNSLNPDDEKFYAHGKVIDIDIYSNLEEKDLDGVYNKQLKNLLKKKKTFNREFLKATRNLLENYPDRCSSELIQEYNRIAMEMDKVPFSNENSVFSGVVLEFTVLCENPVREGSKISGRVGNKGVVSKILPDEEMPTIKSGPRAGEHVEICVNPLGVIGRVNPAQLYEHTLNFSARFIQDKMKEMSFEEARDYYFKFKEKVNPEEFNFEKDFFENDLSSSEQIQYIEECKDRIYFHQEPFWNDMNIDRITNLLNDYDFIEPYECTESNVPLVVADMFYMRLKHEASGKFSARSTSHENLKNAPAKTKAFKYHKAPHSTTPIKIGTMELLNLLLTSNPEAVNELLSSYSTNESAKDQIIYKLLTGDPFDVNLDLILEDEAETKKMVDALFYNLQLKFEEDNDEDNLNILSKINSISNLE